MANPYPCLAAFDRDDGAAVAMWTYRVWSGWKRPHGHVVGQRPRLRRNPQALDLYYLGLP